MAAALDPRTRRLLDDADILVRRSSELQRQALRLSRQLAEILRKPALRAFGTSECSERCRAFFGVDHRVPLSPW